MRLFKNVDIIDLPNIITKGILPASVIGSNWNDHANTTKAGKVYLFRPVNIGDSFPKSYGTALIEVEVDADISKMSANDVHKSDYIEYTIAKILPSQIKSICIPKVFRSRLNAAILADISEKITWCGMSFRLFDSSIKPLPTNDPLFPDFSACYRNATDSEVKIFAETAEFIDSNKFNFMRGINKDNTILDAYDFKYII